MAKQLHWEDVAVGSEVTSLSRMASTQTLVKWAGASGEFFPQHFEETFARKQGVGKPIIHGPLKRAWLVSLMTNWIGDNGALTKLSCRHRGLDWPRMMKSSYEPEEGDSWWCKGKVTNKYVKDDNHYVECEIWVENAKGEKTTTGNATVILPTR